ncbi:hypothetical protein QBE52_10990 [Clostridiaceae bacterium 35-E11]
MWYSEGKKKLHDITINNDLKIIDVINRLNVPKEQINIVLKNGKKVSIDSAMHEGDLIEVVPIIAGG